MRRPWIVRLIRREKVLITYNVNGDAFDENLVWARVSDAQARSMGYLRGKKIKDEMRYFGIRIYVRFSPETVPELPYAEVDGVRVYNYETAETLYDFLKSNTIADFLKGMTSKIQMPKLDQAKLIMIIAIAIGAAAGLYFLLFRGG